LEGGGLTACGLDPSDRRVQALVHVVRGLDQLPRHRSIHVGGFVLTQGELSRVVPIEPAAMKDRTVIQWDKDDLEFAGLIKIDLLGLGMLTCLAKAIRYIRETRGVTIDLAGLPAVDREVYKMIQEADTVGVFQIESRAQMNSLPRLKPETFYDLVVQVALIRPGPIQGDMVHPYVRRRRGEEPVTYLHPDLEPILERTLGVPLFQEQGMKVAGAMAGFTPGQADALRRAMGFKRSKEAMALIEPALRSGMTERGIAQDVQDQIVKQLTAFANYGFPESHSASFALLVYASAYLKRYYAPEFFCGLLNSQPMGFYAPGTLVQDARRHRVEVRPVDLAYSHWDCTLEPTIGEDALPCREGTADPSPRKGGCGGCHGRTFGAPGPVPHSDLTQGRQDAADDLRADASPRREGTEDPVPRKGECGRCHERTFGAPGPVPHSDLTQGRQDAADDLRADASPRREGTAEPSPRKGGCGGCHERTFGAPGPVLYSGLTQRDMKRGHPPHPTNPRDMKRGGSAVPDRTRDMKRGHPPHPTNPRDMKRGDSAVPDRTRGEKREAPPAPALRVGLRYVRGLGREAQERLQAAWKAGGPFESVEDVVRRSGLGLPALKTLAEAGAFDTLWGPGRRSALWEVLARLADKPLAPVEPAADQLAGPEAPHQSRRPKLKEMSKIEMVAADYMTTGLCTHGHPMEHLRAALRDNGVLSAEQLSNVRSGERVKVAGVVICRQRPGTAKGVCFITLEDETGFSNFVVYADLFQRYRRTIVRSPVLLIEGIAQNEQDVVNVQARRISAIASRAGADSVESHDFH
jgi:DNA polymerase III alpha subunit